MYNIASPYTREQLITRNRLYIRTLLGRPLLLTGFIILAVSAFLNMIIAAVFSREIFTVVDAVNKYMQQNAGGFDAEFSINANISTSDLLLMASLLVMYLSSRKPRSASAPKVGVTLFWVWTILMLIGDIGTCLVFITVPLAIFFIVQNVALGDDSLLSEVGNNDLGQRAIYLTLGIVIFVFIVFAALYIIRGISRLRFGSSIRNSISSEILTSKGAVTYAVTNLIISVIPLVSSLFLLMVANSINFKEILSQATIGIPVEIPYDNLLLLATVSSVLTALFPVFMSIFALKYHKHICSAGEHGENLPTIPVAYPADNSPSDNATEPATSNAYGSQNPYESVVDTPAEEPYTKSDTAHPVPRYCNQCGSKTDAGQRFCNQCGARLHN